MLYAAYISTSTPKPDACTLPQPNRPLAEAAAPATTDNQPNDLPTIRRANTPAPIHPFLEIPNPAVCSSPISTAFSPRSICWDDSPAHLDPNADSADEWHSAPSSICSSPCAKPAAKPGVRFTSEEKSELPEDVDVQLHRLVVPCLQCQLKRLPCDRRLPSCSRCLRVNGASEPCLAQRGLSIREMRLGIGVGGVVVPIYSVEAAGDERAWRATVSAVSFSDSRTMLMRSQLLAAEQQRIDRLNWVLPSIHSARGAWMHPELRRRS